MKIFLGGKKKTLPPKWVDNILVTGEEDLRANIIAEKEIIVEREFRIKELKNQVDNIALFKQLLYETGQPLEEVVKLTLEKIGGRIEPSKFEGQEEYLLVTDHEKAVVEVKGRIKSISMSDMREVLDYVNEYLIQKSENVKGVLIGNAWRLDPVDERGTPQKQIFPDNVKRAAKDRDIALISTVELF